MEARSVASTLFLSEFPTLSKSLDWEWAGTAGIEIALAPTEVAAGDCVEDSWLYNDEDCGILLGFRENYELESIFERINLMLTIYKT